VNIASRIQAIATPGNIFISEAVQKIISNKKELTTKFVREEHLKNVKDAIRIYDVIINHPQSFHVDNSIHYETGNGNAKSIAVLPFVNMSNDPEQEYFCDGISEEIINALVQINDLRVIARTSAFSFRGKSIDVREIGKMLDVNTLLEGSVRKAGDHLRITTKLVKAEDGSHLWSNRYDRVLEDVFAIQEDIAESVATALKGVLTNKEKEAIRRPETNIQAYEYYLKGRALFHQIALKEAQLLFEKAIEIGPDYAFAYAGLADAHSWLYEWEGADPDDLMAAEENSQKALLLAPALSESHLSRGFVLSLSEKYDEAEQEFREAIRLNANNFDAYYYFGRSCFARGQIKESADLFRKAAEVRREDYQSLLLLSQSLRILGEPLQEAAFEGIERAKKQLQLDPTDKRALSLAPTSMYDVGLKKEAFEMIDRALDIYPEDTGVLINAACLFAKAHNKEKALTILEKVLGKGFGKKDWIELDPDLDALRDEPRFKALLEKLR
jgi:adenylate cyclase